MPPFDDPLVTRIAAFIVGIGLEVRAAELMEPTFLPGIQMGPGGLVIDESRLRYPGDLLHEAGHLAVMTPAKRAKGHVNAGKNMGEEIGAIAWSYAALTHLGLDPAVVFHAEVTRVGRSRSSMISARAVSSACRYSNGWG